MSLSRLVQKGDLNQQFQSSKIYRFYQTLSELKSAREKLKSHKEKNPTELNHRHIFFF